MARHHRPRSAAHAGGCHAGAHRPAHSRTVERVMRSPDEFDAFYKDARDRLLLADLRADRRPARRAHRGARRVRRRLAPLAQGRPARRPRGLGPAARARPRPAPAHRPPLAPRQGPRRRGPGHPRRARQAAATSARRCCSPPCRRCPWTTWPARSGSPAPRPSARCRPRPRSSPCTASVPSTDVRPRLEALRGPLVGTTLAPAARSSAGPGAARRRTHTLVGVGGGRRRPARLRHRRRLRRRRAEHPRPGEPPCPGSPRAPRRRPTRLRALEDATLLTATQVGATAAASRWSEGETSTTSAATGW